MYDIIYGIIRVSYVMSLISYDITDIIYDSIYNIIDFIYDLLLSFAAADPSPAQRADANDGGHERDTDLDRPMDSDEDSEREFAD
jgi:hypothetical protein